MAFGAAVEFGSRGGDESQAGKLIREDTNYPGSAADFLMQAFQAIGGTDPPAVLLREVEAGQHLFSEQVTVSLVGEMADSSIIRRIFGRGKPRTSLTLSFDRYPEAHAETVAETFTVDTSELAPGEYSLVIAVVDRANEQRASVGCSFALAE